MNSDELNLSQEEIDGHLAHYGVRGQKWGVRRSEKQLARSRGDITKYKDKAKHLTDAELAARIKRLETEKKYRDLNKRDIRTGRKHVNEVLATVGKDTAKRIGTNLAVYAVKQQLGKRTKINMSDAFPKK